MDCPSSARTSPPSGHIGHSNPVAVWNLGHLYVAALKLGEPGFAVVNLLRGIGIHTVLRLAQLLADHLGVAVPDDRIRAFIHKENAAAFLKLDFAGDLGDGIQVYVGDRYAAPSALFSLPEAPTT